MKRSNSREGGRDLSANTKNEKHLVGFRTIIWRVYWTYVRSKLLANIPAGSISRLLLPVDYYCQYILSQCPALFIMRSDSELLIFIFRSEKRMGLLMQSDCAKSDGINLI